MVLTQSRYFSTRLIYATKKTKKIILIWLILNITEHSISLINYNSWKVKQNQNFSKINVNKMMR